MPNTNIEQEKKILAPLLAKLHISPASTEALTRDIYDEVCLAVDDKKFSLDATGRNSLYKIHVSLGKIVNGMSEKEKEIATKDRSSRKSSAIPSILGSGDAEEAELEEDDKTVLGKTVVGEEELTEVAEESEGADEATVLGTGAAVAASRRGPRDSLVDELLSDGEDEGDVDMSGM